MVRQRLLTAALLLMAIGGAAPAGAQARDSVAADQRVHARKDPALAGLLGVLHPGLGHYYAGDWATGRRVQSGALSAITAGLALGVVAAVDGLCLGRCDSDLPTWAEHALIGAGAGLVAVGFGVWGYGAVNAPRAARRTNAARPPSLRLRARYSRRYPDRARIGISAALTL
jgi:hypothetical protein